MTTASDDIKNIDAVLYQWGRWVKAGGSVRHLGYPSSSPFIIKAGGIQLEDSIVLEVDHQVGKLKDPFNGIIKRNYIDPKPDGSKHKYYPENRTQAEMAKTEKVSVTFFVDTLRMARHRLIGALQQIM